MECTLKTVAIVQARMGSTRLPDKVMRPICGTPMIGLVLKRLARATLIDEIVLATSEDPRNEPLAQHVRQLGHAVYRGSENDVLDRYYQVARAARADVVVRVTGDCPLIDPDLVDAVINRFLESVVDYASNIAPPTFPDGLDTEVFSRDALEAAWTHAEAPRDREHVTRFIRESTDFTRANVSHATDHSRERWTVDRLEDVEVVEKIFQHFHPRQDFGWLDVLALRVEHAAWFAANQHLTRNEAPAVAETSAFPRRRNDFTRSRRFSQRIHEVVPGGCHTYSKGDDQFPVTAPSAIVRGAGARVWDLDGNEFIDCSMGLTSVSIGHGYEPVARAVGRAAMQGTNFQRPAALELEAAERFLATVGTGDMVKFAKNGSNVTTAAVKLSRAYTGRTRVAVCRDHNFFSFDDWFIATTPCDRGIPEQVGSLTVGFNYNDIESVESLFADRAHDIACLIMEPVKFDAPRNDFLQNARDLCKTHGAVFILDEMISGFKWGIRGAQDYFGVRPDLSTWGKGIANGFSCCALTGRADIMELGGIRRAGTEKVFLISTTHGAETTGLAALMASVDAFEREGMIASNWERGAGLRRRLNQSIVRCGLTAHLEVKGDPCLLTLVCRNGSGVPDDAYRTLFMQEMIARGVLFQGLFYTTWSHQIPELDRQAVAFDEACVVYAKAIEAGSCEGLLVGPSVKPVFRRTI